MTHIIMAKPKLKVWVNAHADQSEYALMEDMGVPRAESLKAADVVIFVGGADVNPLLYGEEPHKFTHYSEGTDRRDIEGWRAAKEKIKVGICRGGQFLNVMNGGRLWQHVDGHAGSHMLTDLKTGKMWRVSSTHHQQFRPTVGAITIATARQSSRKECEQQNWKLKAHGEARTKLDDYFEIDHEVLYYPKTRSLCFQPHPEYELPVTTALYFEEVFWRCVNHNGK